MGVVGSFGDVIFEVSSERMRTLYDFVRSGSARWANHEVNGAKPKSEFLGPELDKISFQMRFDASCGLNPKEEMDNFLKMCRAGEVAQLIVGGNFLGVDMWKVTSYKQAWQKHDGHGRCIVGVLDVELEEYIRR